MGTIGQALGRGARRDLAHRLKEARRCDARDAILTQWKQTMSGPEWEASDYEWWGLAYAFRHVIDTHLLTLDSRVNRHTMTWRVISVRP